LVASALAGCTPETWLRLTARGWGDTTRIAASSPDLWTQIFTQNRTAVLTALQRLQHALDALGSAVADDDRTRLLHLLEEAKRKRDAVGD
jgi:prephenate dehydrogenase